MLGGADIDEHGGEQWRQFGEEPQLRAGDLDPWRGKRRRRLLLAIDTGIDVHTAILAAVLTGQ
jgi:hypothetical protein